MWLKDYETELMKVVAEDLMKQIYGSISVLYKDPAVELLRLKRKVRYQKLIKAYKNGDRF